jgi:hypothetical protein
VEEEWEVASGETEEEECSEATEVTAAGCLAEMVVVVVTWGVVETLAAAVMAVVVDSKDLESGLRRD